MILLSDSRLTVVMQLALAVWLHYLKLFFTERRLCANLCVSFLLDGIQL